MARFWKTDAQTRVNPLVPDWVFHVEVCGFTFRFHSIEQIEEYRAQFSLKIQPSSADGVYSKRSDANWHRPDFRGDHWDRQTCFNKLPLYLFEGPKRLQVVKALTRALEEFSK